MWSYKLFRIGALVLTLGGVAHLLGHFAGKGQKPVNGTEFQLEELMYGYKTNIMGVMRSQGDIYDGMSLAFSVFLITLAAFGFVLPPSKKPALVFVASLAVMVGISVVYWFAVPTAFLVAALACYAGVAWLEKK